MVPALLGLIVLSSCSDFLDGSKQNRSNIDDSNITQEQRLNQAFAELREVFDGGSLLNQFSIRRYTGYRQEMKKTFIIPLIASLIMGLVTFLLYRFFVFLHLGFFATILALVFAVIVYGTALLALGGLSREELLQMPGGTRVVRLLDIVHALRMKNND